MTAYRTEDGRCERPPFGRAVARWRLAPDGAPIATHASHLLPVRATGRAAMLKVATAAEERAGARVMVWWKGDGAAPVLAHHEDALLLGRAVDDVSLVGLARSGAAGDDAASRIVCAVAARLHAPRADAPPPLVPLGRWFAALEPAATIHGGVLHDAAEAARTLLGAPEDEVVLHGDLHHANVLDFGTREAVSREAATREANLVAIAGRDWRAIDPKGLRGERAFDFANLLCNPDLAVATAPGRLERQATVIAAAARVDRARLLRWVLAFAGLSAAWSIEDGDDPSLALAVASRAAATLGEVAMPQV